MKKLYFKIISLSCVLLAVFALNFGAVFAQQNSLDNSQFKAFKKQTQFEDTKNTDLVTTVGRIVNQALSLLGILFAIYLVYGGFRWLTAQGDDGQVTEAKNIIRNAVIGMIIVLAAYSISSFVTNSLVAATN